MSGETKTAVSAWTIDSLKEHLEAIFFERDHRHQAAQNAAADIVAAVDRRLNERMDAQEKAVSSALVAADRAIVKSEIAAEKRFDAVNEFRGQLRDQAATLLPRSEADARFTAITEKLDAITERFVENEKRTVEVLSRTSGKSEGVAASWGILLGAVGLVAAVASIAFALLRH